MADYLPVRPSQFRSVDLITFADLVDHVLESNGVDASPQHLRRAIRACVDAYREFPSHHEWSYLRRRGQVITEASQSVTFTYDHTGGSSERLVTLSSGTFPSNAEWFWLKVGNVSYRVADRLTSTTAQLDVSLNPGADVASTGALLVRYEYPLPVDYRSGQPLIATDRSRTPVYVDHESFIREYGNESDPNTYTISSSANFHGVPVVDFSAPHGTSVNYEFMYTARPRPVLTFGTSPDYSTGTVATSGTTVTGTGTAWTSRMVGCVIRVSSDSDQPSGYGGSQRVYNPFAEQRVVLAVDSATSLTVDLAFDSTYSGSGHSISDPVDVDAQVCIDALKALAEYKYALISGDPESRELRGQVSPKRERWHEAFLNAKAADHKVYGEVSRLVHSRSPWSPALVDFVRGMQ